jgi:hypothetical protein
VGICPGPRHLKRCFYCRFKGASNASPVRGLSRVLTFYLCGIGVDHLRPARNHDIQHKLGVVVARNPNQACHTVTYHESGNAENGCLWRTIDKHSVQIEVVF